MPGEYWPAAVTVLLWPPGRPAGACPPGPSGPTPPQAGGSRSSRLRFRSGTGAGRSRWPPSRRHPVGCPGRCSGRPRRRGNSGGGRGQRATPCPAPSPPPPRIPSPARAQPPYLRQPVHVARAYRQGHTRAPAQTCWRHAPRPPGANDPRKLPPPTRPRPAQPARNPGTEARWRVGPGGEGRSVHPLVWSLDPPPARGSPCH